MRKNIENTSGVKLQVLIATFGEKGLDNAAHYALPRVEGVEYIISCQIPDGNIPDIPEHLRRPDIDISFSHTRGLSVNRNILLDKISAPYALIADDDLSFNPETLSEIINIFDSNPDRDILALRYRNEDGSYPKAYPPAVTDMARNPKGWYISSIELAFRTDSVRKTGCKFNSNFGAGTDRFPSGEEDIWLHGLLKRNLKGYIVPLEVGIHHGATTSERLALDKRVLHAQGAVAFFIRPYSSFMRLPLRAYRCARDFHGNFFSIWSNMMKGWSMALFHYKRLFKGNEK